MTGLITPTKQLNTTEFERSYTAAHIDIRSDGAMGFLCKVLARVWLRISSGWGDEEHDSLKKYQSSLGQLAAHAAKTEILDVAKAQSYGIAAKPGTSASDPRNYRALRFADLAPKIQAFYQALKGRVEKIAPHNSTVQAALYRAGLQELTAKISDFDMRRYLNGELRQRAFADLENKVLPQEVAYQKLKPLANAINCYILTFIPHQPEAYKLEKQRYLCDTVRQQIIKKHSEKFDTQMDVLRANGEKRIAEEETRCRESIDRTEKTILDLEKQIKNFALVKEETNTEGLELPVLQEHLSKAEQELTNLRIEFDQIRPKVEQHIQDQVNALTLFTTYVTADSYDFYQLLTLSKNVHY